MKRITVVFLVFLFLSACFSMVASGIQIWPGKLTITMDEGYRGEEIKHPIQVTNPHSYDINVSARIDNPSADKLSEGYSYIPNLSWVKTVPEMLYLPAKTSGEFEVFIEIPESERSLHYNESWETWVILSSSSDPESQGDVNIQIELGVKLFIKTPPSIGLTMIQNLYILLGVIISIIVTVVTVFYVKKKKRNVS